MFFHDDILVKDETLSKVWRAAHNQDVNTKDVSLPKICQKLNSLIDSEHMNPKKRLSLRTASELVNGAAKIYKQQIDQLLEDSFKLCFPKASTQEQVMRASPSDSSEDYSPITSSSDQNMRASDSSSESLENVSPLAATEEQMMRASDWPADSFENVSPSAATPEQMMRSSDRPSGNDTSDRQDGGAKAKKRTKISEATQHESSQKGQDEGKKAKKRTRISEATQHESSPKRQDEGKKAKNRTRLSEATQHESSPKRPKTGENPERADTTSPAKSIILKCSTKPKKNKDIQSTRKRKQKDNAPQRRDQASQTTFPPQPTIRFNEFDDNLPIGVLQVYDRNSMNISKIVYGSLNPNIMNLL